MHTTTIIGSAVFLLALTGPAAAEDTAQPAAQEGARSERSATVASDAVVVETADGSLLRGTVVEKVPGNHVTVRLITGETRRIEWTDVARLAPDPRPTPSPGGTLAPDSGAPERKVHVIFTSDHDLAVLERRVAADDWTPVCSGRCSTDVPASGIYRVNGTGVVQSNQFRLPEGRDSATVDASVGTTTQSGWGAILAVTGGGLALVGLVAVGAGVAGLNGVHRYGDPTPVSDSTWRTVAIAGGALTLGGIAMGIGGLSMIFSNATRVHVARGTARAMAFALPGGLTLGPAGVGF